jgi:Multicopper oxidase
MSELQRGRGQSENAIECFWVLQDGVAFVNQCPIMPGHEFTYRFPITDSPGTCESLTS